MHITQTVLKPFTLKILKEFCKNNRLRKYITLKKQDLIDLIVDFITKKDYYDNNKNIVNSAKVPELKNIWKELHFRSGSGIKKKDLQVEIIKSVDYTAFPTSSTKNVKNPKIKIINDNQEKKVIKFTEEEKEEFKKEAERRKELELIQKKKYEEEQEFIQKRNEATKDIHLFKEMLKLNKANLFSNDNLNEWINNRFNKPKDDITIDKVAEIKKSIERWNTRILKITHENLREEFIQIRNGLEEELKHLTIIL